ncbi:MAG: tail fiber domain-containing protein [Sphingobacteriaceae bacterium]
MNFKITTTAFIALTSLVLFSTEVSAQNTTSNLINYSNPLSNSLSYVTRLQPISFEYNKAEAKKLNLPSGLNYGFNAEDLQQVIPGIVKTSHKMVPAGKNSFKTVATKDVDLESLIPLLVGSIKEQQLEIERLKAEMAEMKKQLKK